MMPGPLLVYTISKSLKGGWKTGIYVIAGHLAVEIALIALLLAGLSALMSSQAFSKSIGLVSGAAMAYYAWRLHRSEFLAQGPETKSSTRSAVMGGMMFTALNPGFPIWWATAGTKLLMEGLGQAGMSGAALVLTGHWVADFGYYAFVSALAATGREKTIERYSCQLRDALALLLFAIGAYFFIKSL